MADSKYITFDGRTIEMQETTNKFETCKHRSNGEIEGEIETCCGKAMVKYHKCFKYDLFPLMPQACGICKEGYEKK